MRINYSFNHLLFTFVLTILLFVIVCPLASAQTSLNDIVFDRCNANFANCQIYTMKADGSNQTNLTNNAANDDSLPNWSPDGSRIVFVRDNGIWIMNADGGNKIQLTSVAGDGLPGWSPDGSRIAFSRSNDIYVINVDGSNPVKLTAAGNGERNIGAKWSPDGRKIVFFAVRSATGSDLEIYVMNADGSNQTALTDNATLDAAPNWSPDGSKIAFTAIRIGNNLDIYVMNADGSNQTRITTHAADDLEASWSPDGTKLVFETRRDGNEEIYTMNADGSNPVRLTTNNVPDEAPKWRRSQTVAAPRVVFNDYFGTGRSDYVLLNGDPNGQLHFDILRNPATQPAQIRRVDFGMFNPATGDGDIPLFGADYDGDLKSDVAVWRPSSQTNPNQAFFYVQPSSSSNPKAVQGVPWGLPTDSPATGDFDGDGKDDFTVVRKEGANLSWYILPSGGGGYRRIVFGLTDDFAFTDGIGKDFNGDGRSDLVVVRTDQAGNIIFYIGDALTGNLILAQQWGSIAVQDQPVFAFYANYAGDSRADVGIYYGVCPANPTCANAGTFWFKETGSSNYTVTKFGIPLNGRTGEGDVPMEGDFDGDGKFDITVYRFDNSTFYSLLSSNGQLKTQYFDGNSAAPPSSATNRLESAAQSLGKSIPTGALKGLAATRQPDGSFTIKRRANFFLSK